MRSFLSKSFQSLIAKIATIVYAIRSRHPDPSCPLAPGLHKNAYQFVTKNSNSDRVSLHQTNRVVVLDIMAPLFADWASTGPDTLPAMEMLNGLVGVALGHVVGFSQPAQCIAQLGVDLFDL